MWRRPECKCGRNQAWLPFAIALDYAGFAHLSLTLRPADLEAWTFAAVVRVADAAKIHCRGGRMLAFFVSLRWSRVLVRSASFGLLFFPASGQKSAALRRPKERVQVSSLKTGPLQGRFSCFRRRHLHQKSSEAVTMK